MSIHSDHKALIFIGAIAVLGAAVRVSRAAGNSAPDQQPALARQMQAADSSARAGKSAAHATKRRAPARQRTAAITSDSGHATAPPRDRAWINGRLDLDAATATQVDSLPGVSATMARRIVADRMQRGPFLNLTRLRRVSGVGPKLIQSLDSLVTFSGTVVQPNAQDSIIQKRKRARASP